jgi:hypothetical protein
MQNSRALIFLTCFAGLSISFTSAQTLPVAYDAAPELKASEILQSSYLSNPSYRVREEVKTYLGLNHYVIDSPFGTFVTHGNQMLQERVREIHALAQLHEMTNSREYTDGVKAAAKVSLAVADDLLHSPVETISSVPKGVGKFLGRIGRGAKEIGSGRQRNESEDGVVKSAVGLSSTKRKLCADLGVNPYSTNEVLQSELDRVALVVFAGQITVKLATMPIGGAAGAALTTVSVTDQANKLVYEQSPLDLRKSNLSRLMAMDISPQDAEAFLAASAFTPWNQSQIVGSLDRMTGVKGRDVLLRDATSMSDSETDAVFYEQTAKLIAHAHTNGIVIDRIVLMSGLPVCIGVDGSVIVALHWDYAMWSPRSENFANALESLQLDRTKPASLIVILSGTMSTRLRQELTMRGYRIQDKMIQGPLK